MSANIQRLLSVRSRLSEEIGAFCDAAITRLDSTGYFFEGRAVSISGVAIDAGVIAERREIQDGDKDRRRPGSGSRSRGEEDNSPPPTAYDAELADLNEHPWLTAGRKSNPWSRVLARARLGCPLVVRGAPGGGKTTLSRFSTIQRLRAVQAGLTDHTKLPENSDPMLWTTCTALAQAEDADDPADLAISAAFDVLNLPPGAPARSERVRSWLRTRITAGRCPAVLDSLDEVRADDEPAFRNRSPRLDRLGSPLLLTCRVLEWEDRQHWTGWNQVEQVELAPLTRREQRAYSRRFFRDEVRRPAKLAGFSRQLAQNPSLRKACESPTLLFFAALLHAEGQLAHATRRTELYQRMRRRLFRGEWRGMPQPPDWADGRTRERRVTDWLCEISLELFRAAPAAKIFSLCEWEEALAAPDARRVAAKISPPIAPDDLLADLCKCGLLVDAGWRDDQPYFSFLHRSFLAYLAGAALATRPQAEWLHEVIDHLWFQPAWEDVLLFLAGHLDPAGMDALLNEIERQPEDVFRQRLRWQLRFGEEAKAVSSKWRPPWVACAERLLTRPEDCCAGITARNALWRALGGAARLGTELVETLCIHLDSAIETDLDVRGRAAEALGKMGDAYAVDALLASLDPKREAKGSVRRRCAWALGKIGDARAVEGLLASLDPERETESWVRGSVASAIGKIGDTRAVDALLLCLDPARETRPTMRWQAAQALGVIADARVVDLLLFRLDSDHEPDKRVREELLNALYATGDACSVDVLLARLDPQREPAANVRRKAASLLGEMADVRAVDTLIAHLHLPHEPDSNVRQAIAMALSNIGDARAVDPLLVRLGPAQESDISVRLVAAQALGQIGDARSLEALLSRLDPARESNGQMRSNAALALGLIGDTRAVDALLVCLDPVCETDSDVRRSASLALEYIGDPRVTDAMLASLDPARETDGGVRKEIAWGLGQIGDSRIVDALLPSLNPAHEIESEVRYSIACTLSKIGDERAVGALLASLSPYYEPDYLVRRMVLAALVAILGDRAMNTLLTSINPAREYNSQVRAEAAESLGKIADSRAVDALFSSLDSAREPCSDVRNTVGDVLFAVYWRIKDRTAFLCQAQR